MWQRYRTARGRPTTDSQIAPPSSSSPIFELPAAPVGAISPPVQSQAASSHRASISASLGPSDPSKIPLTIALLESDPRLLVVATEPAFLYLAAAGRISKPLLSRYISQLRLVIQVSISLLGSLLARVDLPYIFASDHSTSLRWRIVQSLSHGLERVHQDLAFLASLAKRYHLDLDFPPRPDVFFAADLPTKQLIDLYRAFWTDPTMSLLEGLTVLWAQLHIRSTAWQFAAKTYRQRQNVRVQSEEMSSQRSKSESVATAPGSNLMAMNADLDAGAICQEMIPYWTSMDFERLVAEVAEVTNLLADREEARRKMHVFKAVWEYLLGIENRMWPSM